MLFNFFCISLDFSHREKSLFVGKNCLKFCQSNSNMHYENFQFFTDTVAVKQVAWISSIFLKLQTKVHWKNGIVVDEDHLDCLNLHNKKIPSSAQFLVWHGKTTSLKRSKDQYDSKDSNKDAILKKAHQKCTVLQFDCKL